MKSLFPSVLARISNEGFTLVETVVAMGLLAVVGVTAISAFWKIMDMQRTADRWSDSDQTRSLVTAALADSSKCATNLTDHATATQVTTTTADLDIAEINQGVSTPVLISNKLGSLSNGVTYDVKLQLPLGATAQSSPLTPYPAGAGRTTTTTRYLANLEIIATIQGMGTANMTSSSVTEIPISMEFDTSNKLVRCTLNPDDTEETLVNNQHTSSDCNALGGTPFPTDRGVLCRFPVMQIKADGTAPTCPGGWTPLAPVSYISTITRDYVYQNCSGQQNDWEGWHYLSGVGGIETHSISLKSGTSTSFNWETWGGATGGSMILVGVIGSFLGPFGLLGIGIGFLFSFTNCTTTPQQVYAQPLSIGCY